MPLCFFGVDTLLRCLPDDIDDAEFFFGRHSGRHCGGPRVEVYLWAEHGFFRSLLAKDRSRKLVAIREHQDAPLELRADFRTWSGMPSPLPPFASRTLQSRVVIAPGAVLRRTSGESIGFVGKPYVGKTSAALALMELGWCLLSDHLLIIRRRDGFAEPYASPLGLRRATLAQFRTSGRLDGLPIRETMSEVSGRVVLVHASDLFQAREPEPEPVNHLVHIREGPRLRVTHRLPRPSLPGFPIDAHADLARWLPETCTELVLPHDHSPDEIADLLGAQL